MAQRTKRTIKRLFFPLAIIVIATSFSGAYFSDSVSVSGNTFQTGNWGAPTPPPSTPGKVVISEVFYDAVGTDTGKEWIELYNSGDLAIDLTGYDLYYGHNYTFPTFSLNGRSFVLIHNNKIGTDSLTDLYTGTTSSGNMGDSYGTVVIFNSTTHNSSTIVDFVQYGSGGHTWESAAATASIWTAGDFVTDVAAGHSIELKDPSIDTNQSGDWRDQSTPSPGSWTP